MQRLKIACLCLVLITVPVIIESCCLNDCCGQSFTRRTFNIDDFTLTATPYPAVPPYPAVASNTILKKLALHVEIKTTLISSLSGQGSGFAAFACDPPPDASNQKITSLVITSNANFSTTTHTITTGSSLNEFFGAYYHNNPTPLESLIGSTNLSSFALRSDDDLDKPQTHTFTVTITLDDGRVFTLVSDRLELAQG